MHPLKRIAPSTGGQCHYTPQFANNLLANQVTSDPNWTLQTSDRPWEMVSKTHTRLPYREDNTR